MKEQRFYLQCKKKIGKYIRHKRYGAALKLIRFCAQDKYYLNDVLADPELEDGLSLIADALGGTADAVTPEEKGPKPVVVFYDQVSLYNRVLSRTYLEGLASVGEIELVYISYQKREDNRLLYEYCEQNGIRFYEIGKRYGYSSLQNLLTLLARIRPDHIISQNHADDFIGVVANLCFAGKAKRHLINITDHAFWIGTRAYDSIVEFRNFGASVSVLLRGIPGDRLIKLPYYASDTVAPFGGLPFDESGKRIVLSGGSVYKTQGSDAFYDVVRHILDTFDDTVFYFLGNNAEDYIRSKFREPRYEGRVFVENERADLDEVLKRAYVYINTYPLIGGLMTLFAMKNGLIPFTLVNADAPANDIRDFVVGGKCDFCFTGVSEMIAEIDRCLSDADAYARRRKEIRTICINKELFNANLKTILLDGKSDFELHVGQVDYDKQREMYLSSYRDNLPVAVFSCRSPYLFFRRPVLYAKGFFALIKRKLGRKHR